MKDSLGDRMKKNYEWRNQLFLTRRSPVIIRIDGKAFHTYTKSFDKPFDSVLMDCMVNATIKVAAEAQGFKAAYVQSDEASILLTDYDNLETEAWFDYRQQKLVSIASSLMTGFFNEEMSKHKKTTQLAFFDARACNIPPEDVVNYFLWRQKDWERNSLSMYCRNFFSHKELQGKSVTERHEMLYGIEKNWATDLTPQQKNGTFILKPDLVLCDVEPRYKDVFRLLDPLLTPNEEGD